MIDKVFQSLDRDIARLNQTLRKDGVAEIPRFFIKLLGQTAVIAAKLDIPVFATADVDAYANFTWLAKERFCAILAEEGLHYDELSNEIWMPRETTYSSIYSGLTFDGYRADLEYVLISKALKAKAKNRVLIRDYLVAGASPLFLNLCKIYGIDLEEFV
ncbi:MAG: hypothetical protein FJ146_09975 [Deltaproteobacteria bacterium]|nr:hypothetical protein [Deltaproteobacteria bacterium]